MKKLAIIPARSGSQRIPRKNIRAFHGSPILKYSIAAAQDAGCFDEIMVSTEDQDFAEVALHCGAQVPFLRSLAASNDVATLADVAEEVLLGYERLGQSFALFCCILPTAPLIRSARIIQALQVLTDSGASSVFPVVRFSYPIQRGLRLVGGQVQMLWPENYERRSQDLEPVYHDCGQFYWVKTEDFKRQKGFFFLRSAAIELSEIEAQDIDSEEDWQIAEIKYAILKGHEP